MTELNGMSESDSSEEVKLPMALFAVERNSNKRLLFDVTNQKIRGVSSSVFPNATCAFENGGWLLMWWRASSFVSTVHVACPGDVYWSVYKHGADADPPPCSAPRAAQRQRQRRLLEPVSIVDVALLGTQAVCLDANGDNLVFDVTEMRRTPAVRPDSGFGQYARSLVAADGEVLLVSRPRTMENAFRFFKLDMEALEWSPLERRELDDTSWFLCKGQSYRARDAGKRRVYTFSGPKQCGGGGSTAEGSAARTLGQGTSLKSMSITNVYAYDLDDGSVEMVIPASIVTEARRWVRPCVFATPAT
ncbi:hypothetical protein C2845_PM10G21330 [Panicum miliaceum]|uniref:KIB1-4 beta-propeller domain-containing protein n=1 Tax=Panicum miliaceum TaxID=4540 RepID=A0A3L6PCR6_PANMI|nr:hypothetical protein C2845_PM10G21330 [Panicum miliaceum]